MQFDQSSSWDEKICKIYKILDKSDNWGNALSHQSLDGVPSIVSPDTRAELSLNTEIYVKPGSALQLECRYANHSSGNSWQIDVGIFVTHSFFCCIFCADS